MTPRILIAAALVVAALAPASASAAPSVTGEFDVSDNPHELTLGPDGNMWVAITGAVAKITPNGDVTEYNPDQVDSPFGITTGPDGNLWVTHTGGVAKFPPSAPLTAQKFSIPEITDPRAITVGPYGKLWTASSDDVIEIPVADPTTYTANPVTGMLARDIETGGDGNLWVADQAENRVVRMTPAGDATFYPAGGQVQGVAAGPGTQVAYSAPGADPQHVGRIIPGGEPLKTPVPLRDPFGITFGQDGAYWFAEFSQNSLGRLTTDGTVTTLGGFTGGPRYVARGPNNTLWVSEDLANKVARVSGVEPPQPVDPGPDPTADVVAPVLSRLAVVPNPVRSGRRIRVRFRLSEAASVRLVIKRIVRRRKAATRGRTIVRPAVQGRNVIRLGRRPRRPGRYRVVATARDAAGNVSQVKRTRFRVRRR